MTQPAGRLPPWPRLVVPTVFAVAGVAVLVSLGTWQLARKAWKEALIDGISQRLAADPAELPPAAAWSSLDRASIEFRRVRLRAELLNDREALVYATGSTLRPDANGPGYWVFTPARLAGGAVVFVDRGFVPEGRQDPARRVPGQLVGMLDIVGVMRWPELPGWFTPPDDPGRNLWFARDPVAMASAKKLGAVAPFYVEQEAPVPPGGLPSPARMRINLPNDHLQYAITWYGLAAGLVAVFLVFARGQLRADAPRGC